jgi:hypothetical protein
MSLHSIFEQMFGKLEVPVHRHPLLTRNTAIEIYGTTSFGKRFPIGLRWSSSSRIGAKALHKLENVVF